MLRRLADTGASVLVTSGTLLEQAAAAAEALPHPPTLVLADSHGDGELPAGCVAAHVLLRRARAAVFDGADPDRLSDTQLLAAAWKHVPPTPVESSWPLFVLYTSGSTGKPKGIVHTHGGYQVGLCATVRLVFDLRPESDLICVVATAGWITGQSYMIAAPLLCRVSSVLLDGSPTSPPDRIAGVISRHRVTVLKAGSTFLRMLMATPDAEAQLARHDLTSLRMGTFCAEPVNEVVQSFAQRHLTSNYINCYWATEHGGVVWGRCHANADQPLRPDTRSWPLPWIDGEVMVEDELGGWRRAADGEQGEVVVRAQYPYMAHTVWQSEGFGDAAWRGDSARWAKYFVAGVGYVQGDAAVRHAGGAFSFHGRSDEVINVAGNRIGTEEIENLLLLDRESPGSPVLNCAVVGMDDPLLGTAPAAFLILRPGTTLQRDDEARLRALVHTRHSAIAVPARFVVVPALPETYSGKYMRRLLRAMLNDAPLGDLGALRNPECVTPVREAVLRSKGGAQPAPAVATQAQPATEEARSDVPSLEQLMQDISALVAEQVGGSDRIDRDRPLMDVGLDSHLLASFAEQLGYATGVSLPSVAVLETGTIRALARRVHQQLLPAPAPSRAVGSSTPMAHGRLQLAAISGRWPGCSSANSWSLAAAAADAVGEVPAARWTLTAAVDIASLSEVQMACVQHAGFVCGAEGFDNDRFGVSAAEAAAMDPQQRLLLEVSYGALHSAGRRRNELLQSGPALGVFVGITNTDFATKLAVQESVYTATGAAVSIAAGRISFVLGLQGPCQSIDTACSSAVVALHAASLSLAADDCDSALAGAVSLILSPRTTIAYAGAGMLSTDGRCKTWDAQANGYVRGEGVGAALLRRDGQHDCRLELASSMVRQDGRSASLTAPSGSAQTTLLAGAFHRAAVQMDSLQLIEAHGTGTALGDPTESRALLQALESEIPSKWTPQRVVLSGVKASVGHLEPAAGMVGLARLALSLAQRVGASNAQLRKLNPIVANSLREVREPRPVLGLHGFQIRSAGAVAGGVSSFGEQRGSILSLPLPPTPTPTSTPTPTLPLTPTPNTNP